MKINLPGVLFIFAGVLLIYSAQADKDPRNVVLEALGSKRRVPDPKPFDYANHMGAGVAGSAGSAANKVPGALGGVPDPGTRPPTTGPSGTGPIVSV